MTVKPENHASPLAQFTRLGVFIDLNRTGSLYLPTLPLMTAAINPGVSG
jgi:hypothetical protein